ncbi:hypothetical protein K450DRAFT_234845 [Umbelopsis ramanniana AG]|uniref:Transmembrane protein 234 homolog n=1 Tax=Umbelopsis ramanniana AG TaxID=1314678 RepID=A0AAD5HF79_UMBRA|nr:uncharacterized protein K450DRAFT_234845 [Umbelopsis ramanniana AG]KAI8580844.1 hypothetical protein K450DRAFT_234845 [Umbelopsis ramanniana AG]
MSAILQYALGFALVGLCWGSSNPFIKRGSEGLEAVSKKYPEGGFRRWRAEMVYLFTRWQYVLPLVINLSGSAAYYYTLGKADLSLAVPITNSVTFIFTLLTGKLLGERVGGVDAWAGIFMIILGILICVSSRLE